MKKKSLTPVQIAESITLKAIYMAKKEELELTQEKIAIELGGPESGQSRAGNYLNGITALNLKAALVFSRMLKAPVRDFSPRLADEIESNNVSSELKETLKRRVDAMSEKAVKATLSYLEFLEGPK